MIVYSGIIALGFLLGGILFSYHLPKWLCGIDITAVSADHNPGTSNAVKYAGAPVGLLCLMADMAKGILPVRLGMNLVDMNHPLFALVMMAPVLGHAIAPCYRRLGGKGIAVSFGVLLALQPVSDAVWILAGLYIFFSLVVVIHPNERRTIVTFISLALWSLLRWHAQRALTLGCIGIALIVIWKNRIMPQL